MGENAKPAVDEGLAILSSLPPWASAKNTFEKRRELGRGSFGVVWQAVLHPGTQGPGRNVALKFVTCTSKGSSRLHDGKVAIAAAEVHFAQEAARIGGEAATDKLAIAEEAWWDQAGQRVIMRLTPRPCSLAGYILGFSTTQIPEGLLPALLEDTSAAVAYLHTLGPGFLHRDIKPANILFGGACLR